MSPGSREQKIQTENLFSIKTGYGHTPLTGLKPPHPAGNPDTSLRRGAVEVLLHRAGEAELKHRGHRSRKGTLHFTTHCTVPWFMT